MTLVKPALAFVVFCTPLWIHSGTTAIQQIALSQATNQPCYVRQPDLSVGTVAYVKGLSTLNGSMPDVGVPIRSGDNLSTAVDGFVAVVLGDGRMASVQPDTHLRISCSVSTVGTDTPATYIIDEAHTLGAIRG